MLEYYKNYLTNLAQTPNENYRDLEQAIISSCFDNTTLLTTIEEDNFDFKFNPIDVWVGTVTDAITNTDKDVRDYRYIYFEDCTHDALRGKYYHFDKNYWLAYESSTTLEAMSNCKVRRCNNKLKWIDKETGKIIEYPCILDYSLSAPSMQVTKKINIPNSHVTVIIQGNKDTIKIKKNQRFIFNQIPFRFTAINNYMQSDYVDEKVPLLFLDCYLDSIQPDDDLENNIAGVGDYKYSIKILEESFEQIKGFKGKLNAVVTLNGQEIDRNIIWKSENENIIKIDNNGNYELIGNNNEVCAIFAQIEDGDAQDSVVISIKENVTIQNDIVIDPIIQELGQYDTVLISAKLYKNGVEQEDKIACIANNVDSSCYYLVDNNDNTFTLGNNKPSQNPLILTFSCGDYEENISIKLGSMF